MAGAAFHGLYSQKQRRQIKPFDKSPDHADTMLVRHEFIEIDGPQGHLPPFRRAKPSRRRDPALRRRLMRQTVEKFSSVGFCHGPGPQESQSRRRF
jgi:hypothetical protein